MIVMNFTLDLKWLRPSLTKAYRKLAQSLKITVKQLNQSQVVEVKLNKVVQELGIRLDSHHKTIEAIPVNVPDQLTQLLMIRLPWLQSKEKGINDNVIYFFIMSLSLNLLIPRLERRRTLTL